MKIPKMGEAWNRYLKAIRPGAEAKGLFSSAKGFIRGGWNAATQGSVATGLSVAGSAAKAGGGWGSIKTGMSMAGRSAKAYLNQGGAADKAIRYGTAAALGGGIIAGAAMIGDDE